MILAQPAPVPRPPDIRAANELTLTQLAHWIRRRWVLSTYVVTGSRTWTDRELVESALSLIPSVTLQLNGKARGLDRMAAAAWPGAKQYFEPRWSELGRRAGHVRNALMMDHMPDLVLAFVRHAGPSNGTRQAIGEANQRGLSVFVFHQAA